MGKYVIKKSDAGFSFNLKAGNGEIIGKSEVYTSMSSCKNGIASVAKNAPIAKSDDTTDENAAHVTNPKFEVYLDKAGEYRFRLKAANGEIILSSEDYKQKSSCMNGIESVKKNADSPIEEAE